MMVSVLDSEKYNNMYEERTNEEKKKAKSLSGGLVIF